MSGDVRNIGLVKSGLELMADTTSNLIVMTGGMGSGKTFSAAMKMAVITAENDAPSIVIEPTYNHIENVFVPEFAKACEVAGIRHKWCPGTSVIKVFSHGRTNLIYCRSADRPERIVGFNAGYGLLDEGARLSRESFEALTGRCRVPGRHKMQMIITTTPEGHNWVYELVSSAAPGDGIRHIKASSLDNPFLSDDYIPNMTRHLSPEQVQAYVHGEFVNFSGGVYRQFQRSKHVRECADPFGGDIVVGADFNVGQMSWVVAKRMGDRLHFWGEVIAPGNTIEQCERLRDFLNAKRREYGVTESMSEIIRRTTVIPDASSSSDKTSAARSDVHHIISAGFHVEKAGSNPFIRDRVFSVNAALADGLLAFDPTGCPKTINAIEQQGYDRYGSPAKGGGIDDITDAVGYAVHRYLPSTRPMGNTTKHGAQSTIERFRNQQRLGT
jgi:phage terminase large subunit